MNRSVIKETKVNPNKVIFLSQNGSKNHENTNQKNYEEFNILSVGRFVPLKGFDIVLRSYAKFLNTLWDVEKAQVLLTIVGKGPEKERLEKLSRELKISDSVRILDWVEKSKLEKIYRETNVFLFPSHEGAGMVIPEALSYGIPVLCFDNYGPGELINDSCGIKTPYSSYEKSVTDFTVMLRKLFLDKELYSKLSKGAVQYFNQRFDWNRKGEQLKEIYSKLAS